MNNNTLNETNDKEKSESLKIYWIIFIILCVCLSSLIGVKYYLTKKAQTSKAVSTFAKTQSTKTKILYSNDRGYSVYADQVFHKDGKKIAFLTFDDGPTRNVTPQILNTLKKYNVHATFFVLGQLSKRNGDLLRQECAEGHSIGNHSYTHEYGKVYRNMDSFLNEINETNKIISKQVGHEFKTDIFRFPGGSFGRSHKKFRDKLKQEGIRYVDWNASSGDAAGLNVPVEKLIQNVKDTSKGKHHLVILMHDAATKKTTAEALPKIIEYLKSEGYTFKTLK